MAENKELGRAGKNRVEAQQAHRFLIGLLEKHRCDFEHLLPWIRKSLVRL